MMEKIKAYFESLEGLTTEALDQSAEKLVREEKRNVALVIAHIAEISRRKADLECGYKNVFEYCTKRLRLSEGSVALRLQVANVSRRLPQLLMALAENRISLTVAGHLAPHLNEDNVDKILTDCDGMTKRDVEEYLVELRPKLVFKPSIRKRPSPSKESEKAPAEEQQEALRNEEPSGPPPPSPSPNVLEPARTDVFNFRFSADRDFREKFERLAEVLGIENPLKNMAEVFERAVDFSLEKKDPKRKLERRLKKERERGAEQVQSRPDEISETGEEEKAESRYISSEVRERVFARAGYQCQFEGPDGTRCSSRTGLEIEHELPFAIYRSHDERRLKVLCRRHNLFQAERVYGAAFIQAKIGEKQNGRREGGP
jgi:hypothetical protein